MLEDNTHITFIIPSIGRDTLIRSIKSLIDQNNPNWKCIIVYDSVDPLDITKDERISFIRTTTKLGKKSGNGNAGLVRNEALKLVKSKWIGLLDDDDIILPNYIDCLLKEEELRPDLECVIFRMYRNNKIIPHHNIKRIRIGNFGISFCFQSKLNYKFVNSNAEDFKFLNILYKNQHQICISPFTTYIVRNSQRKDGIYPKSKRVYLNCR